MLVIDLNILKKFPGEWESCAKEIRGGFAGFDRESPCWKEFNERRKVFVKPGKSPVNSRGLGDTIAKITSAVGITPCGGCNKRKEKLNQMFPYKPSE